METNIEEIWKDVAGYEGQYQISNKGRLKSVKRTIRFKRKNHDEAFYMKEIIKKTSSSHFYTNIGLCKDAKSRTVKMHRLVALAFIPNPENKPYVNHKNGIKHDNRVENLEWTTISENMKHAYSTGLLVRNPKKVYTWKNPKISHTIADQIRGIWNSENRPFLYQVAKQFDISPRLVKKIIDNKVWVRATPKLIDL